MGRALKGLRTIMYLIFICVCTAANGEEAQVLKLGYIDLPEVFDSSGKGAPYNELMARLLKRIALPYDSRFIPSARSNAMMQQGRIDCVFPAIPHFYDRGIPTLLSEATNKVSSHIFSSESPAIKGIAEADEKIIAYRQGMNFGQLVNQYPNVDFVPVETQRNAMSLMYRRKVDGYLAYYPDIILSMSEMEFSRLHVSLDHPLSRSEDKLECSDTPNNRLFIQRFNQELQKMKTSGELRQVLGNYYNF